MMPAGRVVCTRPVQLCPMSRFDPLYTHDPLLYSTDELFRLQGENSRKSSVWERSEELYHLGEKFIGPIKMRIEKL
jgi:hypothetical protein